MNSPIFCVLFFLIISGCVNNNSEAILNTNKPEDNFYDLPLLERINEVDFSKNSRSDPIIRIIMNKPNEHILIFVFEKKEDKKTLYCKTVPKKYYNPFNQGKVIVSYNYFKMDITDIQWADLISLLEKIEMSNNGTETIDGGYLSLEVKINGVYKQTTHWMPFVTGMNDLEAFIKTLRGTLVSGSNLN